MGRARGVTGVVGAPCVAGDALGELVDRLRGHRARAGGGASRGGGDGDGDAEVGMVRQWRLGGEGKTRQVETTILLVLV
jgi:hypothetical protein